MAMDERQKKLSFTPRRASRIKSAKNENKSHRKLFKCNEKQEKKETEKEKQIQNK